MTDLWEGLEARTERPLRPVPDQAEQRLPPQDTAAEKAVLGALILRPDLTPAIDAIIRDDDWYRPAHRLIWDTITERHSNGQAVDTLTLAAAIGTARELSGNGGPLYLSELANDPNVLPDQATWHARIVAARGHERRTVELGTWLTQAGHGGADDEKIQQRIDLHTAQRARTGTTQTSTWAHVDLTDALAGTGPDDTPTLMPRSDGPCLLYPGAIHVLSGEPTSGKTWLALHAIRHELAQDHDVAFIDFEDRAIRVVARLLLIGAHPDQIRSHFRYVRPEIALDTAGRAALATAVTGTTLAVIDGVTEAMTLHGLDLSSNPDVATFYALLPRWIASHDTTVVLIDHVVKDGERQGRWSIGGQHKVAGIDGAAYTVKAVEPFGRGKRGTARVFIAKDRHGHVEEHALGRCAAEFHLDSTDPHVSVATLDPPEAMPTTEAGDMRPTHLMERVSRYLEIHPGESITQVGEAKLGKVVYVRQALHQLVAEGHVEVRPGPRNASHHHVIEPFRRDQEQEPNQ